MPWTSAKWCACFAIIGRCSQMRICGAEVAIGLNSPRYSTGASGFMSHMSMWEEPPQRKKRMVDFAGFFRGGGIAAAPNAERPKLSPAKPTVDAARNVRRLIIGENRGGGMGIVLLFRVAIALND